MTDAELKFMDWLEELIGTARQNNASDRVLAELVATVFISTLFKMGWKLFDPEKDRSPTESSVSLENLHVGATIETSTAVRRITIRDSCHW